MSEKENGNNGGEDEKFKQQSFFDDENGDDENEPDLPKGPPLYRNKVDGDDEVDKVDKKEEKVRYFQESTSVKMYEDERRLLFLQSDIIAKHVGDGKKDKEGFERFHFVTNASFKGKKSDYVRAGRGNYSVCFNLNPEKNILWIRAKDGSIREAKKYLKKNRIGLDENL